MDQLPAGEVNVPNMSEKARGKQRVVYAPDVDDQTAHAIACMGCAPPADAPPMPPPPARAPMDTSGDAELAALLQAEEEAEWRQLQEHLQTQKDAEEDAAYAELFGEADDVEHDFEGLDLDAAQARCDMYAKQTAFLTKMCDDLERSRGFPMPDGCSYDGDVPPVELTAEMLDNNEFGGVPALHPIWSSSPPKKRYKGAIKIDPDSDEEQSEGNAPESLPSSSQATSEAAAIEHLSECFKVEPID